uniref:Tyrosine-protein phosphatase domain-containing protein n=1 Tax=Toxocara canis TaxID=6265 RepID=A0A183U749_TOXCA
LNEKNEKVKLPMGEEVTPAEAPGRQPLDTTCSLVPHGSDESRSPPLTVYEHGDWSGQLGQPIRSMWDNVEKVCEYLYAFIRSSEKRNTVPIRSCTLGVARFAIALVEPIRRSDCSAQAAEQQVSLCVWW